MNLYKIY